MDYTDLKSICLDGVGLSAREHQVIAMLADGFGDKAIGQYLDMSTRHVQTKVSNLRKKLGKQTRLEMARWYEARTAVSLT